MGRRGHNLLEIMLASFVFSAVSLMLLGVWTNHYRAMGKARNYIVASLAPTIKVLQSL